MSAPDRIWVEKSIAEKGNHGSTAWHNTDEDSDIEYVRADLCDTQDARVKRLVDLLNEPVVTHTDQWWIDARNAALRALEQGTP